MFALDIHYQEMHGDLIAIDCKLCGTLLPNSAALKTHLEWHHSANRSSIAHEYAELCQKCGKFFPRGFKFQSHRAFCVIKQAPGQGNSAHRGDATAYYPAAVTPEPAVLTPEGHRSSASCSLKQLIAATLHSGMEYTNNAISQCRGAATAGQCSKNMEWMPLPDDQDVKIIGGD